MSQKRYSLQFNHLTTWSLAWFYVAFSCVTLQHSLSAGAVSRAAEYCICAWPAAPRDHKEKRHGEPNSQRGEQGKTGDAEPSWQEKDVARAKKREAGGKEAEEGGSGQAGGHGAGEIPRELRWWRFHCRLLQFPTPGSLARYGLSTQKEKGGGRRYKD